MNSINVFLSETSLQHVAAIHPPSIGGPEKVKSFILLVLQGALLTNERRMQRKMTDTDECGLCGNDNETLEHALRDCVLANLVWKGVFGL
ncbi:hypothetical protein Scep_021077 [Stephania cephalantha]|uniref:Reverse transcriptase zinc-binding domain-containing protein n=1 Tax=Stephania cephalantha TaxID=152367 RepID=A0AAP0HWJ6_9MAGN